MNLGGIRFEQKELPAVAQRAPVYAIASLDVNNDGNQDLILGKHGMGHPVFRGI